MITRPDLGCCPVLLFIPLCVIRILFLSQPHCMGPTVQLFVVNPSSSPNVVPKLYVTVKN